jgi:hypothetical protein
MTKVKYRLNNPRLAPRRTKLEIAGWAGNREPRANGSREQVWHCVSFSEGAQYGIDLFYPYAFELHVSTKEGRLTLEADWGKPPEGGAAWPPFRNFGDTFYTYHGQPSPFLPSNREGFWQKPPPRKSRQILHGNRATC